MIRSKERRQEIVCVQYANPQVYGPLANIARIFSSLGWRVLFLGIHASGTADRMRFPAIRNVCVRLMPRVQSGILQKLHFFAFVIWTVGTVVLRRPYLVYLSDPLSTPAGLLIKIMTSATVIYHELDSPSPQVAGFFMNLIYRTRTALARRSDANILPSPGRAQAFSETTNRLEQVFCVWNCPDLWEITSNLIKIRTDGHLRLYYHGSLVPHRLPLAVIQALSILPECVDLTIVGYETTGYTLKLLDEAAKHG